MMAPDGSLTTLGQSHRGYSQREKVVRYLLLRPGWHSIMEIHREVGFCRLNSRVAEARKVFKRDGHPFDIVHSIRDGVHGYELVQLTSNPLEGGAASADAPMVASPSSGSGPVGAGRLQAARPSHPSGTLAEPELREGFRTSGGPRSTRKDDRTSGSASGTLEAGACADPSRGAEAPASSGPPASDPESVEARSEQLNLKLGVTV